MTIKEIEKQIISEFQLFDDWMEKYNYIIETGKALPALEETYKQDKYLIKGCQSRVWLHAYLNEGLVVFNADSDALITKGIVALLVRVLSHQPPAEIINADLSFVDATELKDHLSPTRSNGLVSMVRQMKLFAMALSR